VIFYSNKTVGIYQIDSSNSYLEEWFYSNGVIAFNLDNDQVSGGSTGKSPFTGSFTNNGYTLSGVVDFTDRWLIGSGPCEVTLEFIPESAAIDNIYIYYPTSFGSDESVIEYFPMNKELINYPAAKTNIAGLPVTDVAYEAFMGCNNLENITLPESIKTINNTAFCGCDKLTTLTLPESLIRIFGYAFSGCDKLTELKFNGTMAQWLAITKFDNWTNGLAATHVQCTDGQVEI
jgi:hypothetical protein